MQKIMHKMRITYLLLFCMSLLSSCRKQEVCQTADTCQVVLEQGEGFTVENPVCIVEKGKDVTFVLQMKQGYLLDGADYQDYSIGYGMVPCTMELTLHEINYSTVVSVSARKSDCTITYDANGGYWLEQSSLDTQIEVAVERSHLRVNTEIGTNFFSRDGYTLTGWNTKADGSGTHIGLGSRILPEENLVLYAEWCRWTDSSEFQYEADGEKVIITGYMGETAVLCVPAQIDGKTVIAVKEGAFENTVCKTVVLPLTLQKLESGAFRNSQIQELYLYDNIVSVNDYSFEGCTKLQTLHLNAVEPPVYSGTYFDTFQDKYDRLVSLEGKKKIVLFSGSSARFGYDSAKLDAAFPDYEVVNMGVFAYTNALPQLLLILPYMQENDILLHSPEFDAAKRQFCTTSDLDDSFFCMMESNYDTIAKLDIRMLNKVFASLNTYLSNKNGMTAKNYRVSAVDYDEDGNPSGTRTYNEYGDYILYRPNAESEKPVYGLEVAYTVSAFPKYLYIDSVNAIYETFLEKGVHVYFTYAPRNQYAISEESTADARAELDRYLKKELIVPVISDIELSLVTGTYLYGTDNHLSTEGVAIRTEQMIQDLKVQMSMEGIADE